MPQSIDEFYEKVKDIKTREEFLEEINKIKRDCDDLLDDEAAALLLIDMLGRNKENVFKIKDLEPGMECTIFGEVVEIGEIREFDRKNTTNGRVINLKIRDETGSCRLVLWHKDVDLIKNKAIDLGSKVKIINGYVKEGFNGIEINVGRWGMIEILEDKDTKTIQGEVVEIEETRAFFREDGNFGFVKSIVLKDNEGRKSITAWDEKVKDLQKLRKGDLVKIENVNVKQRNGKVEYHLSSRSLISKV